MALRKLRTNSEAEECRSSCESYGLSLDYDSENSSGEDVELDELSIGQLASKRLQTTHSKCAVKRLPTRRPDPNTYNRNALMARENRRKKKEYIENLEKQVSCYKSVNKRLKRLLKQQSQVVTQLRDESKYYRSVLANKSQIISLISAVKSSRSSPPSIAVGDALQSFETFTSGDLCEGLVNDYNSLQAQIQSWDNLFDPNGLSPTEFTDAKPSTEFKKQVTDEHNYSNSCSDEDAGDSGVCLHVSSGKVSLKFCAACHSKKTIGLETVF